MYELRALASHRQIEVPTEMMIHLATNKLWRNMTYTSPTSAFWPALNNHRLVNVLI
jgi:hypothetical protein